MALGLEPGSTVGPFRVEEQLGRGGMASVYRACEPALERDVALKVLPREFLHDPGFAARFQREARAIAKLEHPNIVPIYAYDIDREQGIPWMALRLIKGGTLSQLIRRGPLDPARAVELLRGVADALDYAHESGIVHRDVKPQNVLLDQSGRVYLADFGIAKILESSGGLTATGMITGTPQYMAPEQATGRMVGPAADVYATGIMAYEMLVGTVPFAADTPVAIMMKHVQDPLPLPPPDTVPPPLLRAILKATAKRPEDRWAGAGEFVSALERGLEAPAMPAPADVPTISVPSSRAATVASLPPTVRAGTGSTRAGSTSPSRRGRPGARLLVAVGGTALVLAVVAAGGLFLHRRGEEPVFSPSPTPATDAPLAGEQTGPSSETGLARLRPAPAAGPSTSRPPTPEPTAAAPPATPEPVPPPATPAPTPAPAAATPPPAEPAPPAVDPEVQRLAAALSERDAATRRRAAQDLAALGPAASPALPALIAVLSDRSADVRLRAVEALGRLGPAGQTSVPALAQALRDPEPMVRAEAAKSLGLHGEASADAAESLGRALREPEVAVRREAARALGRLGVRAEPALQDLVHALDDKDRTVKSLAARALGGLGPSARQAVPALTALSRDSDLIVSREAQAALDSIGP